MLSVPGYQTQAQLHESEGSLIYRATREADGRPVVLKVLKDPRPPPERIARFKREHQLVDELDVVGVVDAYDFLHAANHWILVQEDFGGESLARHQLAGQLELDELLAIAVQIADHLAAVHQRAIIHKDLNPANIVYNRDTGVIKLIDFGIATRLSRESVAFDHPSLIEGTLAYISPEQSGRINQPLDHRSDLYSLGCTLYELLVGRPPFEAQDPTELIHAHLARAPASVRDSQLKVPEVIAQILAKLLAKSSSDRYQSARGLRVDLQRCREQWSQRGSIETFTLGTSDVAPRLTIPARLYGRENEAAALLSAFHRVVEGGSELMLVAGAPGIGKSALVKSLYAPITARHGLFVSGKFDQFRRDTPYEPLLDAIDTLVASLLMEPPEHMAHLAKSLSNAAGDMLTAIVDLLPRLELLYERLPPAPSLSAAELGFRFPRALARCIQTFAAPEHPVTLFIDDLQWADSASLDLLELLLAGQPSPYLLIVGAYRDQEVPAAHPLRTLIHRVQDGEVPLNRLQLKPLTLPDTAALIADTLRRDAAEVGAVAEIIQAKTGGNPFFVHTCLGTLADEGALAFDHTSGAWSWDTDRTRLLELSENVVELVIANLRKLPPATCELLTRAACIGSEFELGLLATVVERAVKAVVEALSPALSGSYLLPTNGDYRLLEADLEDTNLGLDITYKFAHDRIQQAAYTLAESEEHRAAIHLAIGRSTESYYGEAATDAHLL
ncbi:MAG: AAA family ATPase, partial [Myxococcales bacterium]|nr:AAA family ATPase [Myxococcales bacterium]